MTAGNTVPGRPAPVGDPGTHRAQPEFQAPAPPSWLFFLPALIVLAVGTVKLWQEQP
jgi:hypothetical protein